MIWPFPAKGCCPFRRWTWRFIMTITLLIDFKKLLWWLQWVSHLSDFDYSARLEEPWMFSDHTNGTLQSHLPSRSSKTPPMCRIHVSHHGSGKLAFQDYFRLISERKDSFVYLQSHFNNKIKPDPQKNWCLGGIRTKISPLFMVPIPPDLRSPAPTPPAVVRALRPHWLRRWRPRPTSPKKGHEHEPHRQNEPLGWGKVTLKKHVQATTSCEKKTDRFQNIFLIFWVYFVFQTQRQKVLWCWTY